MKDTILKDLFVDAELFSKFNIYKDKTGMSGIAIMRKAMDRVNQGMKFPAEPDTKKDIRLKFEMESRRTYKLIQDCEGEFKTLSDLLRKVLRNFLRSV